MFVSLFDFRLPATMPKKKSAPAKPSKSFEESLWETAPKPRGSGVSPEYKQIVLSRILLRFLPKNETPDSEAQDIIKVFPSDPEIRSAA